MVKTKRLSQFDFESLTIEDLVIESKFLSALDICHLLLEDTWFQFTGYCITDSNFLVYDNSKRIYKIFDKGDIMVISSTCFLKQGVKVHFITMSCLVKRGINSLSVRFQN